MNRRLAWLTTGANFALVLALAGCAGSSAPVGLPASAPNVPAAARKTERAPLHLKIKVPHRHRHHAKYVSPATQSMTLKVVSGATTVLSQTIGLTPNSPGCIATLQSTLCNVSFSVPVGSGYTATIATYDATNAGGNELSKGQSVAFNVARGHDNTVALTLNAVPASILTQKTGTTTINVVALDADGNFIIGPGAPTFTASKTAGTAVAAITQPAANAPNKVAFAVAQPPPAPGASETVGVTASYPAGANGCAETGAVCSLSDAATIKYTATGTIFTGDYSNNAVRGFATPFSTLNDVPTVNLGMTAPYVVALGPAQSIFAVTYAATGGLNVYAAPYTASPTSLSNVADDAGGGIAFNSAGSVVIASSGNNTVAEVAPPYTGPVIPITSGVDEPNGIAFDSANNLYVGNGGNLKLGVYASGSYTTQEYSVTLSGSPYSLTTIGSNLYVGEASAVEVFTLPITSSSATPTITITNGVNKAYSVALDAGGDLFVSNYGASTITEYPAPLANLESASVTLSNGLSSPCGSMTFDANGSLYVTNYGSGNIVEFDPPFTSNSVPSGGSVSGAMGDPCYGGLVSSGTGSFTLSVP